MNHTLTITPRRLILLGIFGLFAVLTYGFAAANTMPADTRAGDGSTVISGYSVSGVHYNLSSSNPSQMTSLTFTLTPGLATGGATRISLDGGTTWLPACTSSGPGATSTITCTPASGIAVTSLANLRVVAAQ